MTAELRRAYPEQSGQYGLFKPRAEPGFTAGGHAAVEDRDEHILADRNTLCAALADESINGGNDIQLPGNSQAGGAGAKLADHGFLRAAALQPLDQLGRRPQILLPDDLRLAIDALAFPQVVVRAAADDLLGQRRHVRSYNT